MRRKLIISTILLFTVAGATVFGMKYAHKFRHKKVLAQRKLTQDELIKQVVKSHLDEIVNCYNQRLRDGLDKNGQLKIAWDIDEKGHSLNFEELDNQLNDAELYDCSSQAISEWKFPKGIYFKVNYTFNLKQKSKNDGREIASPDDGQEMALDTE